MSPNDTLNRLFSLEGKRGIVTGGSSGLGLEMCRVLANSGAEVFSLSRSGKVKVQSETPSPETIEHVKVDICDFESVTTVVADIGSSGSIDFLINNAGITKKLRAEDIDMETFETIQKVNVDAGLNLSRVCYPFLKESKDAGRIIFISSMAAHLGFSQVVPYCTSKAAVTGLVRGLAVEWAQDNILVNSIAPGWFPSEMTEGVMDEERKQKILERMPLHRFGKPEELAAMALFLVSPAASYITGQDYAVDGGALAFGF